MVRVSRNYMGRKESPPMSENTVLVPLGLYQVYTIMHDTIPHDTSSNL